MKRLSVLSLLLWLLLPLATAQPRLLHRYDETNSGLQGHTTMLLQDRSGLLWVSTWNGLWRFDGYEFRQLKPQPGDGCSMPTDRIRDIWLADGDGIYLRTDDDIYLFDTRSYRFRDLADDGERQRARQQLSVQPARGIYHDGVIEYTDKQGLCWQLRDDALCCLSTAASPAVDFPLPHTAMVRALMRDSKGRVWMATKEHTALYVLKPDLSLLRTIPTDGQPIYCIAETRSGTIWLGSKPGGLYRVRESADGNFEVKHIGGLCNSNVYHIAEDGLGRLWVATMGGGVSVVEQPDANQPEVTSPLPGYPHDRFQMARYLHITRQGTVLVATTEGLLVGQAGQCLADVRFRAHTKDGHRSGSLSCNATMDIVEDTRGRLFISTETGGICQLLSANQLADTLQFRHYSVASGHLPTDMIQSMALQPDGRLLVVGRSQMALFDPDDAYCESFGHHFFHHAYRFSESRPLLLADGRWLFGTVDGAFTIPQSQMRMNSFQPPLVLTAITLKGGTPDLAANRLDTLCLSPAERSVTIHFAALDYADPQAVVYQYVLGDDTLACHSLGHNHSLTLLDLQPGTYQLRLRSTNASGQWGAAERCLVIIAEPTFWETPWFVLLLVLVIAGVAALVVYTLLYIRRIKRQRQETLEKYLELLNAPASPPTGGQPTGESERNGQPARTQQEGSSPFMQAVLSFVEQNLDNSNADVGRMAEACAVSRSVLQRKMKQLMGVTPLDFLREARIKRACQLLRESDANVSDVAYRCGFSDPKYFSRSFKQSVGVSPSEYKSQQGDSL